MNRGFRIVVGIVFGMAAYAKLIEVTSFMTTLNALSVATASTGYLIATTVVIAEFLVAVALWTNLRGGIEAAISLLICFSTVLLIGIWNGVEVECGCFGSGPSAGLERAVVIDSLLLGLCFFLVSWRREYALPENSPAKLLRWPIHATGNEHE